MAKANEPRVNEEIKVSEVLLIDADGTKVGVVPIEQALQIAESRGLDLVEVAPHANPPVCRVMDYGKYKYQQQKRDKEARKKQKTQTIKEIKMRPKIDEHDYNFKVKAIQKFLRDGHRVKVSVFFRGREMSFLDKGREVLERVARDCDGLGKVDSQPKMEGRYMRMMLVPVLQKSESKSSKD
ncbi:translation initiation factor IF-3 [Acetomicrobium sp.]|uniref:translation initiation factor IF-3 n=1 Tax=Acetomicrobium sp. TaxID=1872099 RepID=UPI002B25B574|nr:translation initiation factor IF-3 [Acetomicrobium sp.]